MNRASVSEMLGELNCLIGEKVYIEIRMQRKAKDAAKWGDNTYEVIFKHKENYYVLEHTITAYNKQDLSANTIANLYVYVMENIDKIRNELKIENGS